MSEISLNFQSYKTSYYEKLSHSYKLAFKKDFLTKNIYESRFNFHNKYTSIVLLDKINSKILAHIGFRIHLANPKICKYIAFRFSTFIDNSLRGKGIYQKMMKYAEDFLKNEFKVDLIYSWPNRINLISCLKDPKYKNLPPINTWQKEIICLKDPIKKDEQIPLSELSSIETKLTFDNSKDLSRLFVNRENKKYFFFKDPDRGSNLILGKSKINNNIFFSVLIGDYLSMPWILSLIKDLGEKSKRNFVQLWCNYSDHENLRIILKNGFEPNGPVFNRGIYYLNQKNISDINLFPSMYHHDAF